ncbi:MAG: EpsG family protein [Alphaproteobacteria bacterium]
MILTLELIFYIFLCFVGLLFCVTSIKSEKTYFAVTLTLFIGYSIITRYAGLDIDMKTYAEALKYDFISLYYLAEPVYWLSSRYVYKILQSEELTFIFYDVLSFLLVLKARKRMEFPQYFPYLFLLFFPAVMGFNNVYRQYLSYSIYLFFMSLVITNAKFMKKSIWLLIAILTHNVAALFSPFFLL